MTGLWLLSPQTPMLFQGQELGTSQPFLYFSDHHDELAEAVREGRREELAGFRSTTHPALRELPGRSRRQSTFLSSKLDEPENYADLPAFALIHDLLKLRREDEIFREQSSQRLHGAVLGTRGVRPPLLQQGRRLPADPDQPRPRSLSDTQLRAALSPAAGHALEAALVQRAPSLRRLGHPAARGRPALAPVRALRGCPGSRAR